MARDLGRFIARNVAVERQDAIMMNCVEDIGTALGDEQRKDAAS